MLLKKLIREKFGTMKNFSEITGISYKTITKYAHGDSDIKNMTSATLYKVLSALEVDFFEFMKEVLEYEESKNKVR